MKVFALFILGLVTALAQARTGNPKDKRGAAAAYANNQDDGVQYANHPSYSRPVYSRIVQPSASVNQKAYIGQQQQYLAPAPVAYSSEQQSVAYAHPTATKLPAAGALQKFSYQPQPHYSLAGDVSSFSYSSPVVKYSNQGVLSQTLGKSPKIAYNPSSTKLTYSSSQTLEKPTYSAPQPQTVAYQKSPVVYQQPQATYQQLNPAAYQQGGPAYQQSYEAPATAYKSSPVAYQPTQVAYQQAPVQYQSSPALYQANAGDAEGAQKYVAGPQLVYTQQYQKQPAPVKESSDASQSQQYSAEIQKYLAQAQQYLAQTEQQQGKGQEYGSAGSSSAREFAYAQPTQDYYSQRPQSYSQSLTKYPQSYSQ